MRDIYTLRLSKEERAAYDEAAAQYEKALSQWIRETLNAQVAYQVELGPTIKETKESQEFDFDL